MRKLFLLTLAIALLFLSGCGSQKPTICHFEHGNFDKSYSNEHVLLNENIFSIQKFPCAFNDKIYISTDINLKNVGDNPVWGRIVCVYNGNVIFSSALLHLEKGSVSKFSIVDYWVFAHKPGGDYVSGAELTKNIKAQIEAAQKADSERKKTDLEKQKANLLQKEADSKQQETEQSTSPPSSSRDTAAVVAFIHKLIDPILKDNAADIVGQIAALPARTTPSPSGGKGQRPDSIAALKALINLEVSTLTGLINSKDAKFDGIQKGVNAIPDLKKDINSKIDSVKALLLAKESAIIASQDTSNSMIKGVEEKLEALLENSKKANTTPNAPNSPNAPVSGYPLQIYFLTDPDSNFDYTTLALEPGTYFRVRLEK